MARKQKINNSLEKLWTGETVGGYKVEQQLGSGFSGVVYKAVKSDVEYAIKIIRKHLISSETKKKKQVNRIANQLKVRDKVNHPNLIRIVDGGECQVNKCIYLVTEYLDEHKYYSLQEIIVGKKGPSISQDRIRPLLGQIASAAEILHINKFEHNDIKPSNIMISKEHDHAVLLDLGVLYELKEEVLIEFNESENSDISGDLIAPGNNNTRFYGTLRYSPPEIANTSKKNKLADNYKYDALSFYQLGAILYVLLTGKSLYHQAKSKVELSSMVFNGLDSQKLYNDFDEKIKDDNLKKLAARCLDKDWKPRYNNVKWSDFNFENLIPTVVMLYAGGTIGSKNDEDSKTRGVMDINLNVFYTTIEKRIRDHYQQIYEPLEAFPFNLDWKALPKEDQILSENATPETWNSIMTAIEDIIIEYGDNKQSAKNNNDTLRLRKPNRYLAGIVILHGTDTLAYTASALTFGLKNLPCPVVVTGSNQPPDEHGLRATNVLEHRSDAWKNLMLCINFIKSFGHRYAQVYIAFNETIFHGANLKKVPLLNTFEISNSKEHALQIPYTFQTIYNDRKYMFKQVDNIFCNNFYGGSYNPETLSQIMSRQTIIPISGVDGKEFSISKYKPGRIELIYNTPISDFTSLNLSEKEAIVLVGYDSNTFSSDTRHSLAKALRSWTQEGKLIFLTSEYGLLPTQVSYDIVGEPIEIINLFGMIKETAIPFVLQLLPKIDMKTFISLSIDSKINKLQEILTKEKWPDNIPGILLGKPFDYLEHKSQLENHLTKEIQFYSSTEKALFDSVSEWPTTNNTKQGRPKNVTLQHELFDWIMLNKCKKTMAAGCAPNEFKELNDMGYRLGKGFHDKIRRNRFYKENTINDDSSFIELDKARQQTFENSAKALLEHFTKRILQQGVSDVISSDLRIENKNGVFTYRLGARINQISGDISDNIFNVKQFDGKEEKFFNKIFSGTPFGETNAEHLAELKKQLDLLTRSNSWYQTITPMNWFTLGLFKGFVCGSLSTLKFDEWIKRFKSHKEPHHELMLRDSIRTKLLASDDKILEFELIYINRDPVV